MLICLFLSQHEPTKISQALDDESWVEAMQEELLQFKIQKVWTLIDLPRGKKAIGTKWRKPYMVYIKLLELDDIIFGSTKKSLCDEFEQIMHNRFQDKYVDEILKKFGFSSLRTASTPMETNKALKKDEDVCACSRFQVQPKVSYLNAVKRIFRYLKSQPKLGLWYPKDSPLILEAFLDSDYAGASLDRKSTTGGCQFLSSRLISWQCKKQTVVANSTTEAEYIAASHCCGQVLWIQNQMLDYGFNFMQTKIHVDNESAICVVKNPVYHSKTKHIEIKHHFIRESYEKRLIEMVKIHTDYNVADLLTKAFDAKETDQLRYLNPGGPPIKVGDEAVHKELGDK
ncbi:hypothetical protein Tco_0233586 [Tanacetum coccineum]